MRGGESSGDDSHPRFLLGNLLDGINLYAYVRNDPLNNVDATGTTCSAGTRIEGASASECKWEESYAFAKQIASARKNRQEALEEAGMDDPAKPLADAAESVAESMSTAGDIIEEAYKSTVGGGILATFVKLFRLGRAADHAIDANKLNPIFNKAEHNLAHLTKTFGSQEAAYRAVDQATQAAIKARGITGVFEITVRVGSQDVTVRGKVIDDVARIGTFFVQ